MTDLSDKMRALAGSGHADALNLRKYADDFDATASGFYAEPQTVDVKKFMAAWARARKTWSAASGEPLV